MRLLLQVEPTAPPVEEPQRLRTPLPLFQMFPFTTAFVRLLPEPTAPTSPPYLLFSLPEERCILISAVACVMLPFSRLATIPPIVEFAPLKAMDSMLPLKPTWLN